LCFFGDLANLNHVYTSCNDLDGWLDVLKAAGEWKTDMEFHQSLGVERLELARRFCISWTPQREDYNT